MKVWGKASRDTHARRLLSSKNIHSSSTPSASNAHVPIKAKIVRITSHLRCPSFLPLRINLITRTEIVIHHTLSAAVSCNAVPLVRGLLQREARPPSQALRFVPSCRNPIKVINCCVAGCWGSTIMPFDRYELVCECVCVREMVCVCPFFFFLLGAKVLWWIYREIKCHFAKLQDLTPENHKLMYNMGAYSNVACSFCPLSLSFICRCDYVDMSTHHTKVRIFTLMSKAAIFHPVTVVLFASPKAQSRLRLPLSGPTHLELDNSSCLPWLFRV